MRATPDIAAEIVQETFCRAWAAHVERSGRFGAWLCQIVRRLAVDMRRREHPADALDDQAVSADAGRITRFSVRISIA